MRIMTRRHHVRQEYSLYNTKDLNSITRSTKRSNGNISRHISNDLVTITTRMRSTYTYAHAHTSHTTMDERNTSTNLFISNRRVKSSRNTMRLFLTTIRLLNMLGRKRQTNSTLVTTTKISSSQRLTTIRTNVKTNNNLNFYTIKSVITMDNRRRPPSINTMITRRTLFYGNIIMTSLPFRRIYRIPRINNLNGIPSILRIRRTTINTNVLLRNLIRRKRLMRRHTILLSTTSINIMIHSTRPNMILPTTLNSSSIGRVPLLNILSNSKRHLRVVPSNELLFLTSLQSSLRLLLNKANSSTYHRHHLRTLRIPNIKRSSTFRILSSTTTRLRLRTI